MRARLRPAAMAVIAGLLAGCLAAPAPDGPSTAASPPPSVAPAGSGTSTPSASSAPSAIPTPAPDPAVLELQATGCPGGVVIEWTPSTHRNFHHYTALRSPEGEISTEYPPIAPAVDWGETYATDAFVTSAVDASILPSSTTWNYRVMAYDILGDAVSASPVRSAKISQVAELGTLEVTDDAGVTRLEWQPFSGSSGCFSSYRLLFGTGHPPSTVLKTISDPSIGSTETDALHSGSTYQLRIEAIRATPLGSFVVARSETVIYTVP